MSYKSNIFALAIGTVLISACGSDKNESTPQRETVQSMSQLKASSMGTCPVISGFYKCIENCGAEKASAAPTFLSLKQIQQKYYYSTGEETNDFVDFLLSKFVFEDEGLLVDGKVHEKSAFLKKELQNINDQLAGVKGFILRESLAYLGIDIDQEMLKIDIPNLIAGYQASCNDNTLNVHFVILNSAVKFKITVPSGDSPFLLLDGYTLEDGKVQAHSTKIQLTEPPIKEKPSEAPKSTLITSWIEKRPHSIRLENSDVYSYWNGDYLNMIFRKVNSNKETEKNLYVANYESYWGEGSDYAYGIDSYEYLYVDLLTLKVFIRDKNGKDKTVGTISEKEGRVVINLPLDCGGWIFKTCELE